LIIVALSLANRCGPIVPQRGRFTNLASQIFQLHVISKKANLYKAEEFQEAEAHCQPNLV
jgi:hypothetical protein